MRDDQKGFWTHLEEMAGSLPDGVRFSWATNFESILVYLHSVEFAITKEILEMALDDWSRVDSEFPWLRIARMKSLSRQRLIFGCHNKGYRTLKMVQNGISTPTLNHYQRRNSTFLWIQAHRSLNDRPFSPRYPAHSWLYVSSSTISSKQSQASGSLARSCRGRHHVDST